MTNTFKSKELTLKKKKNFTFWGFWQKEYSNNFCLIIKLTLVLNKIVTCIRTCQCGIKMVFGVNFS